MTYGNLAPMQKKLTTINKYWPLALLSILIACSNNQQSEAVANVDTSYRMYAIENDKKPGNWGYIIEYNHHLVIKQFIIPAIEGEKPFSSKVDAEKVGELVTSKLNHSLHPSVSKKELDSLGIIRH